MRRKQILKSLVILSSLVTGIGIFANTNNPVQAKVNSEKVKIVSEKQTSSNKVYRLLTTSKNAYAYKNNLKTKSFRLVSEKKNEFKISKTEKVKINGKYETFDFIKSLNNKYSGFVKAKYLKLVNAKVSNPKVSTKPVTKPVVFAKPTSSSSSTHSSQSSSSKPAWYSYSNPTNQSSSNPTQSSNPQQIVDYPTNEINQILSNFWNQVNSIFSFEAPTDSQDTPDEGTSFPSRNITYEIDPNTSSQYYQDFQQAISDWNNTGVVHLAPKNNNPQIYLSVQNADSEQQNEAAIGITETHSSSTINAAGYPTLVYAQSTLFGNMLADKAPDEALAVATHEIGHALGLAHSPNMTDIMYKSGINPNVQKISQQDINTLNKLYANE